MRRTHWSVSPAVQTPLRMSVISYFVNNRDGMTDGRADVESGSAELTDCGTARQADVGPLTDREALPSAVICRFQSVRVCIRSTPHTKRPLPPPPPSPLRPGPGQSAPGTLSPARKVTTTAAAGWPSRAGRRLHVDCVTAAGRPRLGVCPTRGDCTDGRLTTDDGRLTVG